MVLFLKMHCSKVLGPRLWIPGSLRMIVGKLTLDIYVICVIQLDSPNPTFRVVLTVITRAVYLLCLSAHSGALSSANFFSLPKVVISGSPWHVSAVIMIKARQWSCGRLCSCPLLDSSYSLHHCLPCPALRRHLQITATSARAMVFCFC